MKIFKITPENFDWDEWKSVIIIAENEEKALDIAMNKPQPYNPYKSESEQYNVCFKFEAHQMPLSIERINLDKESIVVSEFNGS